MNTLREAAQAALEQWDKVSGVFRMTAETEALRAALAQPEATAADLRVYDAMAANYAHPPRDEWRPASEPPEDDRSVLVWMPGKLGGLAIGRCSRGNWSPYFLGSPVTHWRDVTPPTEGNP